MRFWDTPTGGTPDIILDEYYSEERYAKDIGPAKPRTGESMVGIRIFGCYSLGDHCREFIQSKTKQTLKADQCYEYEYYAQPNFHGIRINNVGIGLSKYKINDLTMRLDLELEQTFQPIEIITKSPGKWVNVSGEFKPKTDYDHIIIGNFETDTDTKFMKVKGGSKYAYYYIDDVSVYEIDCNTKIQKNKSTTYTLENINFMTNSSTVENENAIQGIYENITKNGYTHIIINGYTDDIGSDQYNLKLSKRRAESVRTKLILLGIPSERITAMGLGNTNPIDQNDKSKNRRVEIVVK